jgi:hypothetical protein
MKPHLIALMVVASTFALRNEAAAQDSRQTPVASEPAGRQDITPTPGLAHWKRVPIPSANHLGRMQWHVNAETKTLLCDGDGGHDALVYQSKLSNFVFSVQCRFTKLADTARGYNSGIFVRSSSDLEIWHQCQLGSKSGGFFFGVTPEKGKKTYFNLEKMLKEQQVKEAGDWNTIEIAARGTKLTARINGAVQSEFDQCGLPEGFIGLEAEGYRIEFRNLKLKPLN